MTRPSCDRVERALDAFRETRWSFDVHQSSVALGPTSFETALDDGLLEVAIRVENDDGGVLAVDDGGWREPRIRLDPETGAVPVEEARAALADLTGVVCRVTDLRELSMVTIHDRADASRSPKFALDVRFSARYEGGEPRGGAAWRDRLEPRAVV